MQVEPEKIEHEILYPNHCLYSGFHSCEREQNKKKTSRTTLVVVAYTEWFRSNLSSMVVFSNYGYIVHDTFHTFNSCRALKISSQM